MNKAVCSLIPRCCATLLASLIVVSCSSSDGSYTSQVGSPPPFDFADGEVLRSHMHQLANSMQRLDMSLMVLEERGQAAQLDVISELRDIERIAGVLEEGDLSTTHRFLRNDMQLFLVNVRRAIRDAERSPSNFNTAGRVSGGCVNCHRTVQ